MNAKQWAALIGAGAVAALCAGAFFAGTPEPVEVEQPEPKAERSHARIYSEFTDGYAEGGASCRLGTVSHPYNVKTPSAAEIVWGASGGRTKNAMMHIVNVRTPGLRYIYNKYLKANPGLAGKVVLRLTIAPSGKIVRSRVVRSTTGDSAFDEDVARKVESSFVFDEGGTGNATLTVPFVFYEEERK